MFEEKIFGKIPGEIAVKILLMESLEAFRQNLQQKLLAMSLEESLWKYS